MSAMNAQNPQLFKKIYIWAGFTIDFLDICPLISYAFLYSVWTLARNNYEEKPFDTI